MVADASSTAGMSLAPLLGSLIDRARGAAPSDLAGVIAEECARFGLHDVALYLQDYEQGLLLPLPVHGRSPLAREQVEHGPAGRAFAGAGTTELVEADAASRVRVWLPLQDDTDRVGVMSAVVAPSLVGSNILGQMTALITDLLVTKGKATDYFFLARRTQPMALAAEMQWHLLPPLSMRTPAVEVAGQLTPAYEVGGDSFDYALNGSILHLGIFDAVGHGLHAAILANAVVGAYRHARRGGVSLAEKYALMDDVVRTQFTDEDFVTAHLADLHLPSGRLRWINVGHPRPLLLRDGCVDSLRSRPTLPIGFGGEQPQVAEERLQPGDRVLFFTDGIIEERGVHDARSELDTLKERLQQVQTARAPLHETVRRLSAALLDSRGGLTSDDATLLMVKWPGYTADDMPVPERTGNLR